MEIRQALEAMRNLGVSLNDYDSEALSTLCDFVEDALPSQQARESPPDPSALQPSEVSRIAPPG